MKTNQKYWLIILGWFVLTISLVVILLFLGLVYFAFIPFDEVQEGPKPIARMVVAGSAAFVSLGVFLSLSQLVRGVIQYYRGLVTKAES